MFKKMLFIALLASLVLGLVGCSGGLVDPNDKASTDVPNGKVVTLRLLANDFVQGTIQGDPATYTFRKEAGKVFDGGMYWVQNGTKTDLQEAVRTAGELSGTWSVETDGAGKQVLYVKALDDSDNK